MKEKSFVLGLLGVGDFFLKGSGDVSAVA